MHGKERLLLDAEGHVAQLLPGWTVLPGQMDLEGDMLREMLADPKVIDDFRRDSVQIPPLPTGLRPITTGELIGRWVPVDAGAAVARHQSS